MLNSYQLKKVLLISTLTVILCAPGYAAESLTLLMERAERSQTTAQQTLVDGTRIVATPSSVYVVNEFPKDPNQPGNMRITVNRGIVRVVGGALNRSNPITINTPFAVLTLSNAEVIVSVSNEGITRAVKASVRGSVTMKSAGVARIVKRQGEELISTSRNESPSLVSVKKEMQITSYPVGNTSSSINFDTLSSNPQSPVDSGVGGTDGTGGGSTNLQEDREIRIPDTEVVMPGTTSRSSIFDATIIDPSLPISSTSVSTIQGSVEIKNDPISSVDAGYTAGLVIKDNRGSFDTNYLLSTSDPNQNFSAENAELAPIRSQGTPRAIEMKFNDGAGNSQTLGLTGIVGSNIYTNEGGSATLISNALIETDIKERVAPNINVPEYMKWGVFLGDPNPTNGIEQDSLASWVSGAVSDPGDLPETGSYSYTGSALGVVYHRDDSYLASGTYKSTWDFKTREGMAELSFDDRNYTGETALENSSSQFTGELNRDNQSDVAILEGSFVQNGSDAFAGVMGQFYIDSRDGSDYRAAGTFAAGRDE